MKKVKIVVLIFINIFILFLMSFNPVFSYTLDEVKEIIQYTEVDETEISEEDYDVKIEGSKLQLPIGFPLIRITIPQLIFGSKAYSGQDETIKNNIENQFSYFDIDFFEMYSGKTNKNSNWKKVKNNVQTYFKVAIYISAVLMLSLLIYFGVWISTSAIAGDKNNKMPFAKAFNMNYIDDDIKKEVRRKGFISEWIITLFLLVFLVFIVNIIIGFSSYIDQLTNKSYLNSEHKSDSIVVYVHGLPDYTGLSGNSISFTFVTNAEGLFMFQSQHIWSSFTFQNIWFIIRGLFITIMKYALYFVMVLRMYVIAILIIISPFVVIINGYQKAVYGHKERTQGKFRKWINNRGKLGKFVSNVLGKNTPFNNWIQFFTFLTLIKPIIAIVYNLVK